MPIEVITMADLAVHDPDPGVHDDRSSGRRRCGARVFTITDLGDHVGPKYAGGGSVFLDGFFRVSPVGPGGAV